MTQRLFSAKRFLKSVILGSGALRLCSLFRSPAAVILCYHSVSTDRIGQGDSISPAITVDAEKFDEQMRTLRQHYQPVTMDDIADWLEGGKTLPPRAAAVTFDDGFEDNYAVAAPAMEKYGIYGTFYLTVNNVTKKELPWFCRISYLFKEAQRRKLVLTDDALQRTWNFGDPAENRQAFVQYGHPCIAKTDAALEDYVQKLENGKNAPLGAICW